MHASGDALGREPSQCNAFVILDRERARRVPERREHRVAPKVVNDALDVQRAGADTRAFVVERNGHGLELPFIGAELLRGQVDCRGDNVVWRNAIAKRSHQVALIRLAERETVKESLLPEVLEARPRFAQRNVENESPNPSALYEPPRGQADRIVPKGSFGLVGQNSPRTAFLAYVLPIGNQHFTQHPSDRETSVAVDSTLALLQIHWIARQVPVHDCRTPCVEIQTLLPDGCGRKDMGPEWAVECDAHILGTYGGILALNCTGPVAANRLIEGEHRIGTCQRL